MPRLQSMQRLQRFEALLAQLQVGLSTASWSHTLSCLNELLCNTRVCAGTSASGRPISNFGSPRRDMTTSGSTPVPAAAAAPASPFGAAGLDAAPGVDLVEGPTSASFTSSPGGLDLDTLDGLEPTPIGASASPGILPAEALAPGGGYGAEVVDLLGLELDDSPAPTGPPPPAGGHDRGTQTHEAHFIRSFVAGLSVTGLAAAIRALSPEDASNLRAAMAEAEATPDQDTAEDYGPGPSSTSASSAPSPAPSSP